MNEHEALEEWRKRVFSQDDVPPLEEVRLKTPTGEYVLKNVTTGPLYRVEGDEHSPEITVDLKIYGPAPLSEREKRIAVALIVTTYLLSQSQEAMPLGIAGATVKVLRVTGPLTQEDQRDILNRAIKEIEP